MTDPRTTNPLTISEPDENGKTWALVDMETLRTEAGINDGRGHGSGETECLLCRWSMEEPDPTKGTWAHMTTSLKLAPLEPNLPDSQGLFPVGRSCAAKARRALLRRGLNPASYLGPLGVA